MATEAASIHPVETAIKVSPPLPPPEPRADPRSFRRWFPWLTPGIVAANIAVFVVTMYVNDCPDHSESCILKGIGRFSFQPMKQNPLLGPSANTLEKMGALEVTKVIRGHQGWRLFTCMWLHAGVFHLLANMLSLIFIGIRLEQEFGFVRIGLLYLISGFGGSLLSALFVQTSISVGASGALFGLLGAMLSELITNWTIYSNKLAALLTLVIITVINLAVGILPHVDNFAHIGGFVSGFCLGFVLLIRPQYRWVSQRNVPLGYRSGPVRKHKVYQYILWLIAAIVLITGFTVGLIMLFRGYSPNDHCSWCHYMSCVPTSLWHCNKTSNVYCLVSQTGNQYNLTCEGSRRFRTYMLPNASDTQIQGLCMQLCI